MEGKKNLNWEISVLEAQTGEGKSMWKAKAKEAKRQRLEAKRAKKAAASEQTAGGDTQPNEESKSLGEASGIACDAESKLKRLRLEKTKRKMHFWRRRFSTFMRKIVTLEKQRLFRKAKQARKTIKELEQLRDAGSADLPEDADKQTEEAERVIQKSDEDVKYIMPLPIATLVECLAFRVMKHSPMLREALGETPLSAAAEKINSDPRVKQRILGAVKAVNYTKGAQLDLEGTLGGVKSRKQVNLEKRAERKQARKEQHEVPEQTKRNRIVGIERFSEAGDGSASDADPTMDMDGGAAEEAPATSTFVASLGGDASDVSDVDVSDVDVSMSEDEVQDSSKMQKAKKAKKRGDDNYDEKDDENFAAIYGAAEEKKNRPGQRARRKKFEEVYGNDANHIKLHKKESKKRNSEQRGRRNPASQGAKKPRHDAADAVDAAPAQKREQVHPSWEAKRREKELMAKAKSVKPTKIVFD
ncbi:hypothetical protein LPJ61_003603 [Coemansia biformis]|uniref:Bud22 domain-containing protein n=1 Tax=Coemansia biformis TaxID=1286918 RepID=A0A9W7Y6A4_9FUNG|nr:hypothetical protein LPJ61_003603 [Coemansia biformis]